MDELIALAAKESISFGMLIGVFIYFLKSSKTREDKLNETISDNQEIIKENQEIISNLASDVSKIAEKLETIDKKIDRNGGQVV